MFGAPIAIQFAFLQGIRLWVKNNEVEFSSFNDRALFYAVLYLLRQQEHHSDYFKIKTYPNSELYSTKYEYTLRMGYMFHVN